MKLTGKKALITGGNSGIGLATARLFVAEGAEVAITGRDQKTLDEAVAELRPNARGYRADVTVADDRCAWRLVLRLCKPLASRYRCERAPSSQGSTCHDNFSDDSERTSARRDVDRSPSGSYSHPLSFC